MIRMFKPRRRLIIILRLRRLNELNVLVPLRHRLTTVIILVVKFLIKILLLFRKVMGLTGQPRWVGRVVPFSRRLMYPWAGRLIPILARRSAPLVPMWWTKFQWWGPSLWVVLLTRQNLRQIVV